MPRARSPDRADRDVVAEGEDRRRPLGEVEQTSRRVLAAADLEVRLYLEHGRRSDAQRRYEALRRRLREDFNRDPGFELAGLESTIRR